jgi:hypothetical protein
VRAVPVRLSSAIVAAALLSLAGCTDDGNEASRSAAPSTSATTVPPVSVGRISATISPEAARLGDDVDIDLPTEVRSILERVDQLLQFDSDVTVSIALDADAVIPEVGAGGFTDLASGAARISLDPEHPIGTEQSITVWLPQVLAHELNHSKRILEGPGYGTTVGEAIVTRRVRRRVQLARVPIDPAPAVGQCASARGARPVLDARPIACDNHRHARPAQSVVLRLRRHGSLGRIHRRSDMGA